MTTGKRTLIEQLFDEALEQPVASRTTWLVNACKGDDTVFREVHALLEAHDNADGVLEKFAGNMANVLASALKDEVFSDEIKEAGPYRIVRELGRGGMGVVYLARREDVGLNVALKLVHRSLFDPDLKKRFLVERSILARLEHPNIARLLDAGVTKNDIPYFALEYVEGVPISAYCTSRKLSVQDRITLFLQVARAVQYAHRHSIVHRDLKPGNILVYEDQDGTPCAKLLDFGIAKLIEEPDTESVTMTRTGLRLMTPQYAAPEQVRGEPITTATDVYALGLLLYELLTDTLPYRVGGLPPSQIERIVCEVMPERPSTAVRRQDSGENDRMGQTDNERVFPRYKKLKGDLDAITIKALQKEPVLRYSSVEKMVEDLERYLAGKPVDARGATVRYRTQKFIGRHRWSVLAAVSFVVLLVGYGITVTVQANRIRAALHQARLEEERAVLEAEKARNVTTFLLGLFEASDPAKARGEDIAARELLEIGIQKANALDNQPEVQAEMLDVIGRVYHSLGSLDKARPLLERAVTLREKTLGTKHIETAKGIDNLGVLVLDMGELATAEQLFRKAMAIIEEVEGPDHPDMARCMNNLAGSYYSQGNFAAAESLHWKVLEIERKQLGSEHLNVSNSLNNLSVLLRRKGDYSRAESLQREALAIRRKQLGEEHPDVARSMNNLAVLLKYQEKYEEAEQLQRKTLAVRRKILGESHPEVAISMTNLAGVLQARGVLTEAEMLLRSALEMDRRLLGQRHPVVARILTNLGDVLTDRKAYRQAEQIYREAVSIQEELLGPDHADTQDTRKSMVSLYETWGKPELAVLYRNDSK